MCVTEIYRDRYPDGVVTEFQQLKQCQYGRPGWPCASHRIMENGVRNINFGEPTSELLITRSFTPPRSSHRPEAAIVEVVDDTPRRERRRKHRSSLLMSTFFGPTPSPSPNRRRHRQDRVVVVETPPPSPYVRAPRTRTPPRGALFGEYNMPPSTPPPFIRDVSPPRGRRAESIIINVDRRRSTSTEAVIDAEPARSRTPSPATYRAQQRQEQRDEERAAERRRDERIAILAAETQIQRDHARRARHALENAEIDSRPPTSPRLLRQRMRPVVEQSDRLHEMFGGLNLGESGQRVVAGAMEDADRRARLRRRFSDAGGRVPRRHRVLYDDGRYRYED